MRQRVEQQRGEIEKARKRVENLEELLAQRDAEIRELQKEKKPSRGGADNELRNVIANLEAEILELKS